MHQSLLKIILVPLIVCVTITTFCMELDRSELYRKNISANRELIRGFNHGNIHLVERTLPITKNKDLYYLLRPADNTTPHPYLVSVCPYEIANLNDDIETLTFLSGINWPRENKPVDLMRKPTFLLLACIENDMTELKSLLSKPGYIAQQDKETLKDCLFVAIDNNRYNDDTGFIYALFAHPDMHTYLLNRNLTEYIDFALNPLTANKYGTPHFAAQTLKEINESYNTLADNLKVDISLQANAQKSSSKPRSYLARTLKPRFTKKKTNSTVTIASNETNTDSTALSNEKEKQKDS